MGLPADLRWRAVYKLWLGEMSFSQVADALDAPLMPVTCRWVKDMWQLFVATGDVEDRQGQRVRPPANAIFDFGSDTLLINMLLDAPECMLIEHHKEFEETTGKKVHISTLCRAVWRVGFTRQRLQQYAKERDAHAARCFKEMVAKRYKLEQLLAVDETSKDKRAFRRTFGYATRGGPAIGNSGLGPRGERVSALCSFDMHGCAARTRARAADS